MSNRTSTWSRRALIAIAVVAASVPGAGAAHAGHAVPDLPVATEPCRLDTRPSWPSCGTALRLTGGSTGSTAIVVGTGFACTGGANEPIHCTPVFIGCTDDQKLCASTG